MAYSDIKITEINALVAEFIAGSLSKSEWTHHPHLIVCTYFLSKYELFDATLRIKLGIIKYNEAIGLENTIERGYHETLTLFWIWAVSAYLEDKESWSLAAKINGLLGSPFSKKYLPFFFYSEDHIFSRKARARWVDPDERALDKQAIIKEYSKSIWFG